MDFDLVVKQAYLNAINESAKLAGNKEITIDDIVSARLDDNIEERHWDTFNDYSRTYHGIRGSYWQHTPTKKDPDAKRRVNHDVELDYHDMLKLLLGVVVNDN